MIDVMVCQHGVELFGHTIPHTHDSPRLIVLVIKNADPGFSKRGVNSTVNIVIEFMNN